MDAEATIQSDLPEAQKHIRQAIDIMNRHLGSIAATERAPTLAPSIASLQYLNEALHAARSAQKGACEYRTLSAFSNRR